MTQGQGLGGRRLDHVLQELQLDMIRRCAMVAQDPRPAGRAVFRAQVAALAHVAAAVSAAETAVRIASADIPIMPIPLAAPGV